MKFALTLAAVTILLVVAEAFEDRMEVIKKCKEKSGLDDVKVVLDKTCDIKQIEKDPAYPKYLDCFATTMGFIDENKNVDKDKLYQYKIEVEKLDEKLAKDISEGCSNVEGEGEEKALNLRKCVCSKLN